MSRHELGVDFHPCRTSGSETPRGFLEGLSRRRIFASYKLRQQGKVRGSSSKLGKFELTNSYGGSPGKSVRYHAPECFFHGYVHSWEEQFEPLSSRGECVNGSQPVAVREHGYQYQEQVSLRTGYIEELTSGAQGVCSRRWRGAPRIWPRLKCPMLPTSFSPDGRRIALYQSASTARWRVLADFGRQLLSATRQPRHRGGPFWTETRLRSNSQEPRSVRTQSSIPAVS